MPYPEQFIAPMRAELTRLGVQELRTTADVDSAVSSSGTVMLVVNSVCGCAAADNPLLPRQTLVRGPEVTSDVRACQG